jgi:hypothetical protein
MQKRATILTAIAAFAMGGMVGAVALLAEPPADSAATMPHPVWREVRWPFPMDQWGKGTAFQCKAADCGTEVNVYLRAKIGFCQCSSGVSDDAELDRISDFDLFGGQVSAQRPGRPIRVGWMAGRSRPFAAVGAKQDGVGILSVGFNDHCDALVATATLRRGQPAAIEPAVLEFLNSEIVVQWAKTTLGL